MLRKLSQDEEIVKLKSLLTEACDTLNLYYPELFSSRLAEWYQAVKYQKAQARIEASDAGLADSALRTMMSETHETTGDIV